jgi:hypothetical protein
MFRRVVRGEWATDCGEGFIMIGFERGTPGPFIVRLSSSSSGGDAGIEGPFGDVRRDRWRAGVDREAFPCILRGWCIIIVRRERRETRFGRESTR